MYWTAHPSHSVNIEGILDKGLSGLEELLDLDNIILRTRNGDERVLEYLTNEAILGKLVEYAMGHGLQGEKGMRYPLIACELLCCEQSILWTSLAHAPALLASLWCFPTNDRPMAPFLVCWARVANHLLSKIPTVMADSIMEHPAFLSDAVENLGSLEVCEVLFRLLTLRTATETAILGWFLSEQQLIKRIFDLITVDRDSNVHMAAMNAVTALLAFPFPEEFPLALIIESMLEELSTLLSRTIPSDGLDNSLFASAIDLVCLLAIKIVQHMEEKEWFVLRGELAAVLIPFLEKFNALVDPRSENPQPYQSPSGPISPVGIIRLKTAKLFSHLTLLQDSRIIEQIKILGTCSSLLVCMHIR